MFQKYVFTFLLVLCSASSDDKRFIMMNPNQTSVQQQLQNIQTQLQELTGKFITQQQENTKLTTTVTLQHNVISGLQKTISELNVRVSQQEATIRNLQRIPTVLDQIQANIVSLDDTKNLEIQKLASDVTLLQSTVTSWNYTNVKTHELLTYPQGNGATDNITGILDTVSDIELKLVAIESENKYLKNTTSDLQSSVDSHGVITMDLQNTILQLQTNLTSLDTFEKAALQEKDCDFARSDVIRNITDFLCRYGQHANISVRKDPYVGAAVVRGRDWRYRNQDGTPPGTGRIVEGSTLPGWVSVRWSNGNENYYRVGAEGHYDLYYDPKEMLQFHEVFCAQ